MPFLARFPPLLLGFRDARLQRMHAAPHASVPEQFSTLAFLPLFEGLKVMFFPALTSSNLLKSQCFFQVSGYLKEAEKLSIWNLRNRAF